MLIMCGRYLIDDEAYADILQILHDMNAAQDRINMDNISRVGRGAVATGEVRHGEIVAGEDGHADIIRGEIFPTNVAPVIKRDGVEVVKWGFPHWKNTSVIINARSETALEKKMFGKPLRERRCVVPSSGFYEWGHKSDFSQGNAGLPGYESLFGNEVPHGSMESRSKNKRKSKFLLRQPEENMLYMAGMVSTFRDAFGEEYDAFVILTTVANDSVSPIHDRMPVILAPDETSLWVQDDRFMEYVLLRPGPELSLSMVS